MRGAKRLLGRPTVPALFALALVATFAGQSAGDEVPVVLSFSDGSVTEVVENPDGVVSGDLFAASGTVDGGAWTSDWSVSGDIDPVLSFAFAVTNNTAAVSDYFVSLLLPVSPVLPSSIVGGSVSGSLTDGNGDGAVLTDAAGAPLYTALIDAVPIATLVDAPFSYSVGAPYSSTIVPSAQFGAPVPSQPGPPVFANIGVNLAFALSPGDSASFNGVFVVDPSEKEIVPEPASLMLLGLGLAGMAMRGTRKLRAAA